LGQYVLLEERLPQGFGFSFSSLLYPFSTYTGRPYAMFWQIECFSDTING